MSKATRFNFYRDGMEPEDRGDWIRARELPPEIRVKYVEAQRLTTEEEQEEADAEAEGRD